MTQGEVQASVRAVTGTTDDWNGDWHALFTLAGIPDGDWNGRMLRWINLKMGASYTNLPEAEQAFALSQGAYNWSSLGTFSASVASLSISGTPVTTATQFAAYTGFSVTGANGTPPYTYSVQSGTLPTGLSLNSSTGAVSGTPTVTGTQTGIVLRVTDSAAVPAHADLAAFQIAVANAPARAMSSRLNVMGWNGYAGSDGTDTDSNTRLTTANESGAQVNKVKLIFSNWNIVQTSAGEAVGPNTITFTASIEYPAGTFNQVLFSGIATCTLAAGFTSILSDELTLSTPIPAATRFFVRTYAFGGGGGQKWPQGYLISTAQGEAADFSTTVDKTMGGTITNATATVNRRGFGPTAIICTAYNSAPRTVVVAGMGDSIIMGATDGNITTQGNTGWLGRACSNARPYLNAALTGTRGFENLPANSVGRYDLFVKAGVTHVVCDYSSNDITAARTAVQVESSIQSIVTGIKANGQSIIWTVCTPKTTGTWATGAGQTIASGGFSGGAAGVRGTVNAWLRANTPGALAVWDVDTVVETNITNALTQDGGYWISYNLGVGASSIYLTNAGGTSTQATTDGLHPSITGTGTTGGILILRDFAIPLVAAL